MKLKVELTRWNGIAVDGDPPYPEPEYDLVDADTNRSLVDGPFTTCTELEAHIAVNFPNCERWVPPPPSADDALKLDRVFALIEQSASDKFNPQAVRPFLVGQLYQSGYPPEMVARIRRALGLHANMIPNG